MQQLADLIEYQDIYIASLLLALTTLPSFAQTIIKPGDKIIRYDLIRPSHSFYKNVTTDSSGDNMLGM